MTPAKKAPSLRTPRNTLSGRPKFDLQQYIHTNLDTVVKLPMAELISKAEGIAGCDVTPTNLLNIFKMFNVTYPQADRSIAALEKKIGEQADQLELLARLCVQICTATGAELTTPEFEVAQNFVTQSDEDLFKH